MHISPRSDTAAKTRITRLDMIAETFEEERILTSILKSITLGGIITASYPRDDGKDNVLEFEFRKTERSP